MKGNPWGYPGDHGNGILMGYGHFCNYFIYIHYVYIYMIIPAHIYIYDYRNIYIHVCVCVGILCSWLFCGSFVFALAATHCLILTSIGQDERMIG